jgi:hypothetical protein
VVDWKLGWSISGIFKNSKPTDSPIDHPTDRRSSLDFSWVDGKITFRPDSPDL